MPKRDGQPRTLEDVVNEIIDVADEAGADEAGADESGADRAETGGTVTVDQVQEKVGRRSFGPLLLILGLIALTPIGGIPGVPTLFGLVVLLTAGQLLIGRRSFWLPAFITKRSIGAKRLKKAAKSAGPAARWVDTLLRPRLDMLTDDRGVYGIAVACVVLALTLPVLEVVPMAGFVPAAAITAFALALVARDGVLAIIGYAAAAVTLYLVVTTVFL